MILTSKDIRAVFEVLDIVEKTLSIHCSTTTRAQRENAALMLLKDLGDSGYHIRFPEEVT